MSIEYQNLNYDVSHITSADVVPLEAKMADIARRRAAVAVVADDAATSRSKAQQQLADIAAGLAVGKVQSPSMTTAANNAAREADAHAEMASNALKMLDQEHEETSYQLYHANRHRALELYRAQIGVERSVAEALDRAAAAFNAAFEAWKDARIKTVSMFPSHNGMGGGNPFPHGGAGLMGSISIHPEVAIGLARLGFTPPDRGLVVRYTQALG